MKVGSKIREFRKLKNISQGEVASAANISQAMLSQFENDNYSPSLDMLEMICHALDINMIQLLPTDVIEGYIQFRQRNDVLQNLTIEEYDQLCILVSMLLDREK